MTTILAVDPGNDKCGIAILGERGVIGKQIVKRHEVVSLVAANIKDYGVDEIVVGNGTGSRKLVGELEAIIGNVPIHIVDESHTTERARSRYFAENPPRGIYRLVPKGLLTPKVPYDDYTAVIIAEDYLNSKSNVSKSNC